MPHVILTAVGPDRAGLVDDLTGYLHDLGANVADSSMVNLRGRFALLLLAEATTEQTVKIQAEAATLGEKIGLSIDVKVDADEQGGDAGDESTLYRLKTVARDQPGIVHRITHVLHDFNINIEELQTRLEVGAYGQVPHFHMEMLLAVPATVDEPALREKVESLCSERHSTFELQRAQVSA